ncbi:hypothetical protein B0J17DRAFT_624722 [Rhizoctonia solani]|nr:hypothetical protein B0J17DRAFT_624722 [Rhizoctonia solani]
MNIFWLRASLGVIDTLAGWWSTPITSITAVKWEIFAGRRIRRWESVNVMVTYNIKTELDVANRPRGVVQRIMLDHHEELAPISNPDSSKSTEVILSYPPECILVRLYRTKAAEIQSGPRHYSNLAYVSKIRNNPQAEQAGRSYTTPVTYHGCIYFYGLSAAGPNNQKGYRRHCAAIFGRLTRTCQCPDFDVVRYEHKRTMRKKETSL